MHLGACIFLMSLVEIFFQVRASYVEYCFVSGTFEIKSMDQWFYKDDNHYTYCHPICEAGPIGHECPAQYMLINSRCIHIHPTRVPFRYHGTICQDHMIGFAFEGEDIPSLSSFGIDLPLYQSGIMRDLGTIAYELKDGNQEYICSTQCWKTECLERCLKRTAHSTYLYYDRATECTECISIGSTSSSSFTTTKNSTKSAASPTSTPVSTIDLITSNPEPVTMPNTTAVSPETSAVASINGNTTTHETSSVTSVSSATETTPIFPPMNNGTVSFPTSTISYSASPPSSTETPSSSIESSSINTSYASPMSTRQQKSIPTSWPQTTLTMSTSAATTNGSAFFGKCFLKFKYLGCVESSGLLSDHLNSNLRSLWKYKNRTLAHVNSPLICAGVCEHYSFMVVRGSRCTCINATTAAVTAVPWEEFWNGTADSTCDKSCPIAMASCTSSGSCGDSDHALTFVQDSGNCTMPTLHEWCNQSCGTWSSEKLSCFRYIDVANDWDNAQMMCQHLSAYIPPSAKGHLAHPSTDATAKAALTADYGGSQVWIGLRKTRRADSCTRCAPSHCTTTTTTSSTTTTASTSTAPSTTTPALVPVTSAIISPSNSDFTTELDQIENGNASNQTKTGDQENVALTTSTPSPMRPEKAGEKHIENFWLLDPIRAEAFIDIYPVIKTLPPSWKAFEEMTSDELFNVAKFLSDMGIPLEVKYPWTTPDFRLVEECIECHPEGTDRCYAVSASNDTDGKEYKHCVCKEHYIGYRCEMVAETCVPNPCENGAVCETAEAPLGDFRCVCPSTHRGKTCDIAKTSFMSDGEGKRIEIFIFLACGFMTITSLFEFILGIFSKSVDYPQAARLLLKAWNGVEGYRILTATHQGGWAGGIWHELMIKAGLGIIIPLVYTIGIAAFLWPKSMTIEHNSFLSVENNDPLPWWTFPFYVLIATIAIANELCWNEIDKTYKARSALMTRRGSDRQADILHSAFSWMFMLPEIMMEVLATLLLATAIDRQTLGHSVGAFMIIIIWALLTLFHRLMLHEGVRKFLGCFPIFAACYNRVFSGFVRRVLQAPSLEPIIEKEKPKPTPKSPMKPTKRDPNFVDYYF